MNPADTLFTGDFRLRAIRAIRRDAQENPSQYPPEVVEAANRLSLWTEFAEIVQKYAGDLPVCTENE
jgi:hypothetical protein